MDFFFIEEDGSRFKVSFPYQPYFYIQTKPDTEKEVVAYYSKRFIGRIAGMDLVEKEDLDLVCTYVCMYVRMYVSMYLYMYV